MVAFAVRELLVPFEAAVNVTVPLPVSLAGDTVSQLAPDDAVQLQPAGALTATGTLPPPAGTDAVVGVTVNVQLAPACVTVTA